MQNYRSKFIFVVLLISFKETLSAENLTLHEAVQQALATNPDLLTAQARVDEARGQQRQAGLRPNPRLFLQSEDIRFWEAGSHSFANATEDYGYVGQVLETAGKRARRVDVANATVAMNSAQQQRVRRQLQFSVAGAYWGAAAAFRIRDLLEQNLSTYEEDLVYSRNRVREGVMAESDLMRTELERDRIRAEALLARRDADQAVVNLYRTIGKPAAPQVALTDSIETIPTAAIPDVEMVERSRPEYKAAQAAVSEAEANVRLQMANAKPDPEAIFGYKRDVGYDTLYASVQIDLPTSNRNQGNIASAQAQVRAAQSSLRLTDVAIRDEIAGATRAYQAQRELLTTLPATRSRAEEIARLARAAYREGAIDLLRLLDAERTRIDVEIQYYRALAQLQQAVLDLSLASGAAVPGETQP